MNQPQQQPALFKIDGHNVHCVTAAELTAFFQSKRVKGLQMCVATILV